MTEMSFDQLKELNKAEELEAQRLAEQAAKDEEAELEEPKKEAAAPDGDSGKEGESGDEDWLAEEPEGEKPEGEEAGGKVVPLKALISTRDKLKGKLADKDSEIAKRDEALAKMQQEIEALKQTKHSAVPEKVEPNVLKYPERLDYDTEEAFQLALLAYTDKVLEHKLALRDQTQNAKLRQETEAKKVSEAVDAHYKRTAEFLQKNNVSEERYQRADRNVRETIESIFPGKGDAYTDTLIAKLVEGVGQGSEIAMMYIGTKEEARALLAEKLRTDPSGLTAIAYMTRLAVEKSGARTNSSTGAPAPAARVRGPNKGTSNVSGDDLRKIYKAGTKDGGLTQEAFDAKMKAKAAGVDVSKW